MDQMELIKTIEKAAHEGAIVIAVLSACFWDETPLKDIQTTHNPDKPPDGLRPVAKRNEALKSICRELIGPGTE